MAKNNNNIILAGTSGHINKEIVIKQYSYGTVITKFPDMSNVVPSKKQKKAKTWFAQAVAFAQSINNNPVEKAKWMKKVKKGSSVYQTALKWYLNNNKQTP